MNFDELAVFLILTPVGRIIFAESLFIILYLMFNFIALKEYWFEVKLWFKKKKGYGIQEIHYPNGQMNKRIEKLKQDSWQVTEGDRDYLYQTDFKCIIRRQSDNMAIIRHMYNVPTPIDEYNQKRDIYLSKEDVANLEFEERKVTKDGVPLIKDGKEVTVSIAKYQIPQANWNLNLTADKMDAYLKRFKLLGSMMDFIKMLKRQQIVMIVGFCIVLLFMLVLLIILIKNNGDTQTLLKQIIITMQQKTLGT